MPSVAFPNVERLNKPSGTKVEVASGPKAWPELAGAAMPQEAPPQPVCANVPKTPTEQQPGDQRAEETVPCEIPGPDGKTRPTRPLTVSQVPGQDA